MLVFVGTGHWRLDKYCEKYFLGKKMQMGNYPAAGIHYKIKPDSSSELC